MEDVKRLLSDPEVTSARLVVNPEKMVVDEARRTYTYLGLFGYGVDGVVVNRVLPEAVDDPYFAGWRAIQAKHMETIISSFPDIPVLPLRLFDEEMVGVERLRLLAGELYGERDPVRGFTATSPFTVEEHDNEVTLNMAAPFVDKADLEVLRHGDELYVTVGPYRRSFVLPDSLRRREVSRARLEEGSLLVTFTETGRSR